MAEWIFSLLITEVIRRLGPWRGVSEVWFATHQWVEWSAIVAIRNCSGIDPTQSSSRPTIVNTESRPRWPDSTNQASDETRGGS